MDNWNPSKGLANRDIAENSWSSSARQEAQSRHDSLFDSQKSEVDRHASSMFSSDRDAQKRDAFWK